MVQLSIIEHFLLYHETLSIVNKLFHIFNIFLDICIYI